MTIDEKLDFLLSEMQSIKANMHSMEANMSTKDDIAEIKSELSTVKQKVTSIEMTIENEMQVNIMRVAEGHIDLSRNLAEIKRSVELLDGKMEINDLFIRHHDSEIKKLKAL